MRTVACIICKEILDNSFAMSGDIQPIGGLHFFTYGHYGSTYFDPMDGSTLNLAICDDCVYQNIKYISKT